MSYLRERVSYLKGLAEGMQISDATNEGKLLKAMLEVLDDITYAVDDIEEIQEEIINQVNDIDEDLTDVEKVIFDEEDEEDDDDEDEECIGEFECPHCHQLICLDEDMFDDDGDTIKCPNCHEEVEVEWQCNCEDCDDHQH